MRFPFLYQTSVEDSIGVSVGFSSTRCHHVSPVSSEAWVRIPPLPPCFNIDDVEDNKDSHSSDALFSIYSTLECYMIYTYASTNCMLIDIL